LRVAGGLQKKARREVTGHAEQKASQVVGKVNPIVLQVVRFFFPNMSPDRLIAEHHRLRGQVGDQSVAIRLGLFVIVV
jgi:hypothetical protein